LVDRSKASKKPYGGAVEVGSTLESSQVHPFVVKESRIEFCQINSLKSRIPKSSSFGCTVRLLVFKLESKSVSFAIGVPVGVQVGSFVFGLPVGVRFGFKSSPESLQSLLSRCLCPS
jgi:hypothetical protein